MSSKIAELANKWATSSPEIIKWSKVNMDRLKRAHRVSYPAAYSVVDELNRFLAAKHPTLGCENGCSHCCKNVRVNSEKGAVDLITERIKSDPELLAMVKTNLAALPEAMGEDDGIRCPLLNENNRCSVYDIRPINCRQYHSISEQACINQIAGTQKIMDHIVSYDAIGMMYNSGLIAKLAKHGKVGQNVQLHEYLKEKLLGENA